MDATRPCTVHRSSFFLSGILAVVACLSLHAEAEGAQSGGFIFSSINSGSVINNGMEIALTGKPVETRDFDWNVTLNISYNKGRVGDFLPGVAYFYPTDAQFGTVKAASMP